MPKIKPFKVFSIDEDMVMELYEQKDAEFYKGSMTSFIHSIIARYLDDKKREQKGSKSKEM